MIINKLFPEIIGLTIEVIEVLKIIDPLLIFNRYKYGSVAIIILSLNIITGFE